MLSPVRPRRADAERNREQILDAAEQRLRTDSRASMADIAAEAGVSRVTMYGHFSSRGELVEAVFTRAMERADSALATLDRGGDPWDALHRLVDASWQLIAASQLILRAAIDECGPDVVRQHHGEPFARVDKLIRRGRKSGIFRRDLPEAWLITCFYSILHAAADDLAAERLTDAAAERVVWPTIASVFRRVPT